MYACIYCDPDFSCTRVDIQPEVVQEVLADLKMMILGSLDLRFFPFYMDPLLSIILKILFVAICTQLTMSVVAYNVHNYSHDVHSVHTNVQNIKVCT